MKNRKDDIERYLRGELSAAEMHALEKEALDDPFLAEALEGIEQTGADNFLYDLHRINRKVHKRTHKRSRKHDVSLRMWGWTVGIAATLFLVAFSAFVVISLLKEQERARQLAMEESLRSLALLTDTGERDTIAIPLPNERPAVIQRRTTRPLRSNDVNQKAEGDLNKPDVAPVGEAPPEPDATAQLEAEQELLARDENSKEAVKSRQDAQQADPSSGVKFENAPATIQDNAGTAKKETRVAARQPDKQTPAVDSSERPDSILVRGRVTSVDGENLPGVNVIIKGTSKGTVTDIEGNFQLAVPHGPSDLSFSLIGFTSQEVAVQEQTALNVQLQEDVASLSEVVVTGYSRGVDASESSATFTFAEPSGGRSDFRSYLNSAVKYPEEALRNKAEGRVTVRFTVEPSGALSGFEVLKGIGHGCDEELIRAIREGPAWKPSRRGETPVRDSVKVRFKFELPPADR